MVILAAELKASWRDLSVLLPPLVGVSFAIRCHLSNDSLIGRSWRTLHHEHSVGLICRLKPEQVLATGNRGELDNRVVRADRHVALVH